MRADRLRRIAVAAELPADVETEADALVEVLHEVPAVRDVRIHLGRVRPVVVDRVADVELLDELVDVLELLARALARAPTVLLVHRVVGNAHDDLGAEALRELEVLADRLVVLRVERTEPVARHAVLRALRLERRDLLVARRVLEVEVLHAQVVQVQGLHDLQRLVKGLHAHRVAREAEPERHLPRALPRRVLHDDVLRPARAVLARTVLLSLRGASDHDRRHRGKQHRFHFTSLHSTFLLSTLYPLHSTPYTL